MPQNQCSQCNGNGECVICNGTGINTHIQEAEPKCQTCKGTGKCPACGGTGRWYLRPPEILDLGLDQ